jgi:hypothetical protein
LQPFLRGGGDSENIDNVKILIDHGADVNLIQDSTYGTPLVQALMSQGVKKAKYLLSHGADYSDTKFVTIKGDKLNILYFLRELEFPLESDEYKTKMEIVSFLQKRGLNYWSFPIPIQILSAHKNDAAYLAKY